MSALSMIYQHARQRLLWWWPAFPSPHRLLVHIPLNPSSQFPSPLFMLVPPADMVVKELGKGTFAKVVQCLDLLHSKHVAVKVIKNLNAYR